MAYQLILSVYEGTTNEQMLSEASFTINAKFFHTYTFSLMSEQEKNAIQAAKLPLKITLHNHTENQNLHRTLQVFFSTKAAILNFTEVTPKNVGIDFKIYQYLDNEEHYYVVRIISNLLAPTAFEQLQSTLITYFDLDPKSTAEMLSLAGPMPASVLKARQAHLCTFEATLKQSTTKDIGLICKQLLETATIYDESENLGQNASTLALGYIVLSLKLYDQAQLIFEKIKKQVANKEYILAQRELMKLYRSSDERIDLKRCFIAAQECQDVPQATLCANLLCAFKSPEQFFNNSDFQYIQPHQSSEKNHPEESYVLFKIFAKIKAQQQAIRELNLLLQNKRIHSISDRAPIMRGIYTTAGVKALEQEFLSALENSNPSVAAYYANRLCGFYDNTKLFTTHDFECITQNSDDEEEYEDQDITTDVLFMLFEKIKNQEQEIKRLEADIRAKKTVPTLEVDFAIPAPMVAFKFRDTPDSGKKNKISTATLASTNR